MPKFYVESGNFQLVVHAKNARGAAIWAMHRAMSQMLPFLTDRTVAFEGDEPLRLGELIKTSQRGFGRTDAAVHDTFDVLNEWHRLMVALDKLEQEASVEGTAV